MVENKYSAFNILLAVHNYRIKYLYVLYVHGEWV